MSRTFQRRVQLTGGATLIVSLPKEWVRRVNIKAGDIVTVIPQPDNSLKIVPGRKKLLIPTRVVMQVDEDMDPKTAVRELIARYLVGYETIEVRFSGESYTYKKMMREIVSKKMIGVEVVEETVDSIVFQCLAGPRELPAVSALRRMMTVTANMLIDVVGCIDDYNRSVLEEIEIREDTVDKLYFYIVRQLKSVAMGLVLPHEIGLDSIRDALGYRLIVKSTERIADHINRIAHTLLENGPLKPRHMVKSLKELGMESVDTFSMTITAMFKRDKNKGHEVVQRSRVLKSKVGDFIQTLLESRISIQDMIAMRLIIESLERVSDYSADIAEIVINLMTEPPIKY